MALTAQECRDLVRIVFLCMFWYAVSSSNGVLGKWILSEFPFPMTLTMVQLTSIAVYSGPMLSLMGVRGCSSSILTWKCYFTLIFPLAFAKFGSSVLSHVSIWKVPVSYAHTVKASMPLFTVAISRILFGERHSYAVYFSLLPIVMGVAVATVTEASFDVLGLGSALAATAGFSMMNIFSKKALKDTGMHHLKLLCTLGRIACLMFFPFWLIFDGKKVAENLTDENSVSSSIVFLLVVDGVTHWLQNILAFTILKLVAPLTYAVANVTKRISIISVSIVLIGNQVTASNVGGMLLAIAGVFHYNKVKYEENRARSSLPTTSFKKENSAKTSSILWSHQSAGVAEDSLHRVKLAAAAATSHAHSSSGTPTYNINNNNNNNGFTTYTNYFQQNNGFALNQHGVNHNVNHGVNHGANHSVNHGANNTVNHGVNHGANHVSSNGYANGYNNIHSSNSSFRPNVVNGGGLRPSAYNNHSSSSNYGHGNSNVNASSSYVNSANYNSGRVGASSYTSGNRKDI